MNRDNHDKQMLKAIQRIARSLESLVQIETIVHEDLLNTVGEEYMQGRIDAEEDAENRMNGILDDEKRLAYEQGRKDAIKEFATAYRHAELIGCEDCRHLDDNVRCWECIAEQLKEKK